MTRRGRVAAVVLQEAVSSVEDCLYCDGPEEVAEMFEWETFATEGTDDLRACGTSSGQATSMDMLRTALLRLDSPTAWGRITHRVYDFGIVPDDWSRRVIFRATVDPSGSVRFERIAP